MTINLYLVPRLRIGGAVGVPNVVLIPLKSSGYFIYYNVQHSQILRPVHGMYEGWNFNSGNYLFTTDTK